MQGTMATASSLSESSSLRRSLENDEVSTSTCPVAWLMVTATCSWPSTTCKTAQEQRGRASAVVSCSRGRVLCS